MDRSMVEAMGTTVLHHTNDHKPWRTATVLLM